MLSISRSVGRGEGKSDVSVTCTCGQGVLVRVLSIGRGIVSLGFRADRSVRITRSDAKSRAEKGVSGADH